MTEAALTSPRTIGFRLRANVALKAVRAGAGDMKVGPRDPWPAGCGGRGDGKVTTGITGLWQPSVHSDVAF